MCGSARRRTPRRPTGPGAACSASTSRYTPVPLGATIRNRFVALDPADGWIEVSRSPLWTLSSPGGPATLSLTVFPVAPGVVINLERLRALENERRRVAARDRHAVRSDGGDTVAGTFFVDETSWTEGRVFCVAPTKRIELEALGFTGLRGLKREWTVSDGQHVLEASLWADTDAAFKHAIAPCEEMIRSVRFECQS